MRNDLPLHIAIASDIPWEAGLKELVYANPSALGSRYESPHAMLVPFLHQVIQSTKDNEGRSKPTKLNTAYCLLREDPSVLSTLVASS